MTPEAGRPGPSRSGDPARPSAAPGPRGLPLLGSLPAFARDRTGFLLRTARTYGDLARFHLGGREVWLVSRPDLIQEVLVNRRRSVVKGRGLERARELLGEGLITSEGELHLRHRRLVQPAFHRERVAGHAPAMVRHAARLAERWKDGETVDAAAEMSRLSLEVAAETLFGARFGEVEARRVGEDLAAVMDWFWRFTLPFSRLLDRAPLPASRRFRRARRRLEETAARIVAEREERIAAAGRGDAAAGGADGPDVLALLLAGRDDIASAHVRDHVLTVLLAGHETMANALTWTWHLLSRHPEVEARLHEEIRGVLGGRAPDHEDLPQLPYAGRVMAESMRLFPPVWLVARRALEPLPLDGRTIPAGAILFMSQWVVHHDPRYFPDPFRFDPDRWLPGAAAVRPRFSYFPFGGGVRHCLGEQFAWTEGVLVLATLAARWRLRATPGPPPTLEPAITLRPRGGLPVRLARREAAP